MFIQKIVYSTISILHYNIAAPLHWSTLALQHCFSFSGNRTPFSLRFLSDHFEFAGAMAEINKPGEWCWVHTPLNFFSYSCKRLKCLQERLATWLFWTILWRLIALNRFKLNSWSEFLHLEDQLKVSVDSKLLGLSFLAVKSFTKLTFRAFQMRDSLECQHELIVKLFIIRKFRGWNQRCNICRPELIVHFLIFPGVGFRLTYTLQPCSTT